MMNSKKIFIVGVGRSGTSMLQAMLASHSEIYFLPETGFFRRYVMERALSGESDSQASRLLENDARMDRLGVDLSSTLGKAIQDPDVELAFYDLCCKASNGFRFVGDKDPKNVEYIEPISRIWPDSKIIHIYRDPRDVLASKKKAEWSRDKSTFFHLVAGAAHFRFAYDHLESASVFHLAYEDLLQAPTDQLKKLCDWLSIPYEASMEDFGREAKRLVSYDEQQWKKETLGPLLQRNSGKWKATLSKFEAIATETACRQAMVVGSYELLQDASFIEAACGKAFGLSARIAALFYRMKRSGSNREFLRRLPGQS